MLVCSIEAVPSDLDRFMRKVDMVPGSCWEWRATLNVQGHGQFSMRGRLMQAHRFSYEYNVGPVSVGLELDHLCRNRSCVNPAHLEPVTHRENVLRGVSPAALHARKTHCRLGHPFTGDNLKTNKNGSRSCRICQRSSQRVTYHKLKPPNRGLARGEKNHLAKLTATVVVEIRALVSRGETHAEIARRMGLAKSTVRRAAIGETWAHIEPIIDEKNVTGSAREALA